MRARAASPDSAEKTVRDIRRATGRQYSAEEKIRIVLEGLRGEASIAERCRKEGIAQSMYYGWSKEFLETGTTFFVAISQIRRLRAFDSATPSAARILNLLLLGFGHTIESDAITFGSIQPEALQLLPFDHHRGDLLKLKT
jgi:transposase-like protein